MENCKTYSREEIEQKAQELLQTVALTDGIVPVIKIAEKNNIIFLEDKKYTADKDGHIDITSENQVRIIINSNKPVTRKRFTIAHEIGHFVLHRNYLEQHRSIDRKGNISSSDYLKREREANQFAASLLMPTKLFLEIWQSFDKTNYENKSNAIAEYFGVSKEAAYYRAIDLGLLNS